MRVSQAEFVNIWHECGGSPQRVAERIGIDVRRVYERRASFAKRGVAVLTAIPQGNAPAMFAVEYAPAYPREKRVDMANGTMLVGSDAHIWPGPNTPAMNGFLAAIDILKPDRICFNGDILDGARISRHGRIGWARTPTLKEEREAVQAFADAVVTRSAAANKAVEWDWNLGNHCLRYDSYLSRQAPELEGEPLARLEDHFPRWQFQMSVLFNADAPNPVMVKHRYAGGIHAGYNNAMKSGYTMVTGHTHLLEAKPWGDYRGRRWGIQTGSLADLHGPQFEYHENAPSSACSGFVALTFRDGDLMPPELAEVINGRCYFRGQVIA